MENELAALILSNHRYLERIRFVSSGTEAAMSAIRLARGVTGRSKIIKFDGCYHGHVDALLVNAGSGLATLGTSSVQVFPKLMRAKPLCCRSMTAKHSKRQFKLYKGEIACVAIEPIPANNGLLIQDIDFLRFVREITKREGIILLLMKSLADFE